MGKQTSIEWTDHTFNPWWGCTPVSGACDHCYAERWAKRTGHQVWGHAALRRELSDSYWKQPYNWDKSAAIEGVRRRVFCASMADVFEWRADLSPLRERLWELIESTPNLDWLLLTKRPHLINRLSPWKHSAPRNVWFGTTTENQKWAEKRIPHLLETSSEIKFLSCEPLLSEVDLKPWLGETGINWVIAGGESGAYARPTDPAWFLSLRNQCVDAKIAFHFKQWGDWAPVDKGSKAPQFEPLSGSLSLFRVGKKAGGRLLEGSVWSQLPLVRKIEPELQHLP